MDPIVENIKNDLYAALKEWREENWQKPLGFLVVGLLIWITVCTFLEENSFLKQLSEIFISYTNATLNIKCAKYILYLLILLAIYIVLFSKIKYPITPPDKIGIYLAILNDYKDKESEIFLNKITIEIDQALKKNKTRSVFNVTRLDRYKTLKIINGGTNFYDPLIKKPRFQINLDKTRWTFLMYGRLKYAQGYKLEVDYAIRHKENINLLQSIEMGKDFKNFLKKQQWEFPESKERKAIEITSENIRENIYFSLGASLLANGLVKEAYNFHAEIYDLIQPKLKINPRFGWINNKIKKFLSGECFILGNYYHLKEDLEQAIFWQEKSVNFNPQNYYAHINLASSYYLSNDISNAYKQIDLAKKVSLDASFKLSKAFLKIDIEKKYHEGSDLYVETLRRGYLPEDIVKGTVLFFNSESQKDKPTSLFIKGLIYYFKINKIEGKKLLSKFINENKDTKEYEYLIKTAKKYLA